MRRIFNKIVAKICNNFRCVVANTIFKNKIDNENNCFNMYSDVELVDQIVNNRKSFARFGDGELSIILNKNFNINFQSNSLELRERLIDVLNSNVDNLILGISVGFNNPSEYNEKIQKYYRSFNYKYRNKYKKIIPSNNVYGNTSITRFYMDYDHNDLASAKKRLDNLKRIWNKRKLLIVEGNLTKLGVGNDLFDNAKSIRRIIIPATNAYSKIEEIEKTIIDNYKNGELVLMAAGPAATILAHDMALNDIQSIDIGHIDIEYEWMKMKCDKRVAIKGKYVNEAKGKKYIEDNSHNKTYEKQIIANLNS